MEGSASSFVQRLEKDYIVEAAQKASVLNICNAWAYDTIEQQKHKLEYLISTLTTVSTSSKTTKTKDDSDRSSYKTKTITEIVEIALSQSDLASDKPKTVLDIGAGSGEILSALAKHYRILRANAFGLDEKLTTSKIFTPIKYGVDADTQSKTRIPLETGSVDLIVLTMVLHHIHPEDRKVLMKEIARVLSDKGSVVIQEHDYDYTTQMFVFIDVLHNYWYVKGSEAPDPLYLMSSEETINLFSEVGLSQRIASLPAGNQRAYWSTFDKQGARGVIITSMYSMGKYNEYLLSEEYALIKHLRTAVSLSVLPMSDSAMYISADGDRPVIAHTNALLRYLDMFDAVGFVSSVDKPSDYEAIAFACYELNKTCTLFLNIKQASHANASTIGNKAYIYWANVIGIDNTSERHRKALEHSNKHNTVYIQTLNTPEYLALLKQSD